MIGDNSHFVILAYGLAAALRGGYRRRLVRRGRRLARRPRAGGRAEP